MLDPNVPNPVPNGKCFIIKANPSLIIKDLGENLLGLKNVNKICSQAEYITTSMPIPDINHILFLLKTMNHI